MRGSSVQSRQAAPSDFVLRYTQDYAGISPCLYLQMLNNTSQKNLGIGFLLVRQYFLFYVLQLGNFVWHAYSPIGVVQHDIWRKI